MRPRRLRPIDKRRDAADAVALCLLLATGGSVISCDLAFGAGALGAVV